MTMREKPTRFTVATMIISALCAVAVSCGAVGGDVRGGQRVAQASCLIEQPNDATDMAGKGPAPRFSLVVGGSGSGR